MHLQDCGKYSRSRGDLFSTYLVDMLSLRDISYADGLDSPGQLNTSGRFAFVNENEGARLERDECSVVHSKIGHSRRKAAATPTIAAMTACHQCYCALRDRERRFQLFLE